MTGDEAREQLDSSWFWIKVCVAGIVFLFICFLYLANSKWANDADRRAQQRVANTSSVTSCIVSARSTPGVIKVLDLLQVLANNSILANQAALDADPNGPLSQVRKDSIARLTPALPAIKDFRDASRKGQRFIKDCRLLAKNLDVEIEPLLKEGT